MAGRGRWAGCTAAAVDAGWVEGTAAEPEQRTAVQMTSPPAHPPAQGTARGEGTHSRMNAWHFCCCCKMGTHAKCMPGSCCGPAVSPVLHALYCMPGTVCPVLCLLT